jgi:phosphatidylglycerol lysyltransferase
MPSLRWLRLLGPVFALALVALAARHLAGLDPRAVVEALGALSPARWAAALGATALSFAALAGAEVLAVRALGLPLPTATVVGGGLAGWAVGQALGPAWLSGGAVRLRVYGRAGVTGGDVARIVGATLGGFWASLVLLAAVAALAAPGLRLAGGLVLAAAAVAVAVLPGRSWTVRGVTLVVPARATLARQVAVGALDTVAACLALAACLPASVPFPTLLGAFSGALVAGVASGAPGGLGALDAALVTLLPQVPAAEVLAGLLAWRLVYAVVPLVLALGGLALAELRARPALQGALGAAAQAVAGPALAAVAALTGTGLLVSTFAPAAPAPVAWLGAPLPDEVLAASHAATAAVGVGLWFVARGLLGRTREAWTALVGLLLAGAAASLGRGVDADGLAALGLAGLALPLRAAFFRRAALGREDWAPRTWGWVAAAGLVVALALGSAWVDVDAPAGLAPLSVAAGALAAAALGSTLRPARARPPAPSEADLADAVRIATAAGASVGWMAATGDKALLFDADREAFLMYGVVRDRWVAFTGPIGPPERRAPLLATFRERARRAGARVALYEVPADLLPACADHGLRAYKFGEEARVPLAGVTLEGGANKSRRALVNKLEREGASFAVLPAAEVPAALDALRAVSDAWLAEKGTKEKAFSLGRFDPAWLSRAPVAVVRVDGRIVAFANLLAAGPELSVDLMRFHPDAPKGVMDYLFVKLLLHAKAAGHATFVLGMAPLSGLSTAPGAPAWSRAAGLVYAHGERLYGFRGLRAYKEKFHPEWAPRYVAVEGRFGLLPALGSVLALVGAPVRS